jgi:hypothetical protein
MQAANNSINAKYGLSAADKENKSERQALVLKTVRRNIIKGNVGTDALSKGKTPQISRDWLKLIAVHANMCQVGATGELNSRAIIGVMNASAKDTVHEDTYNTDYAWTHWFRSYTGS